MKRFPGVEHLAEFACESEEGRLSDDAAHQSGALHADGESNVSQ